ncbi:MAG: protein kinase [Candidatus Wallbacteria bacterium]|nr:protein kinase [Candidatus Wallbacteria bacterium]
MIRPGTIIADKYQLLELVEENEKFFVYKALTVSSEERRAVKILKPSLLKNERLIDRMIGELQNMASLRHESLVRIYDIDVVDKIFYIASEWVDGIPLTTFIDKGRKIPLMRALLIIKRLGFLLEFATKQGIIYRSIKLSNILLTGDFKVKVLGFNLPRSYGVLGDPNLTQNVGVDPDIFFLGVVLYSMLEAKFPIKKRDFIITDIKLLRYLELDCDWKLSDENLEPKLISLVEELIRRSVSREMNERIPDFYNFFQYIDMAFLLLNKPEEHTTAREVVETLREELPAPSSGKILPGLYGKLSFLIYLAAISLLIFAIYLLV